MACPVPALRPLTFSGVASNFAGVPLALAFIFTLGQLGMVTSFLGGSVSTRTGLHDLLQDRPRARLPVLPVPTHGADHRAGHRRAARGMAEAAENMGASPFQYWRRVALPILFPSILGAMILLFGNAFGAQATAYQLTGGTIRSCP